MENGVRHFKNPKVAEVYSLPRFDDRSSLTERVVNNVFQVLNGGKDKKFQRLNKVSLFDIGMMNSTSGIYRNDLWEKYGYDTEISSYGGDEDSEWWMNYLKQGFDLICDPSFSVYHAMEIVY